MTPKNQQIATFLATTAAISAATLAAPYISITAVVSTLGVSAITGALAIPSAMWGKLSPEIQTVIATALIAPALHLGMRTLLEGGLNAALASGAFMGCVAGMSALENRGFVTVATIAALVATSALAATFSQAAMTLSYTDALLQTTATATSFVIGLMGGTGVAVASDSIPSLGKL